MKKLLLATAALLALGSAAGAVDLGQTGVQLNSTLVVEFDTTADLWTTTYTPQLRYVIADGLSTYIETDYDLQDIDFTGATVGLEYYPGIGKLDLMTYVKSTSDADFEFDTAIVGAELKF